MFLKKAVYFLTFMLLFVLSQTAVSATTTPPLPLPEPISLVDINTSPVSSSPLNFLNGNGTLFFTADDGIHGRELWQSDGTEAGTTLVKNLDDSADDSSPNGLVYYNNVVFFATSAGLWKSDGTEAGTTLVSSQINGSSLLYPTIWNDILFFTTLSLELWRTDGTEAGTYKISSTSWHALAATNNGLFFIYQASGHGQELWISDGTVDGTMMVKDIAVGVEHSKISQLTGIGDTLFFAANDVTHGWELWQSDGTEVGTSMVKNISPNEWHSPANLTNFHGLLIFTIEDSLWQSDGTEAGTVEITPATSMSGPQEFNVWQNHVYFIANGPSGNNKVLWQTDGTNGGTIMLENSVKLTSVEEFAQTDSNLFFLARDTVTNQTRLWATNGTSGNAQIVSSIPNLIALDDSASIGDRLYFDATGPAHGSEPWQSDGTENGTSIVKNIHLRTQSTIFNDRASLNGILYFVSATEGGFFGPNLLWRSDGTKTGTYLFQTDPPFAGPDNLVVVDNSLFFSAIRETQPNVSERGIYKSDGTESGTTVVKYFDLYDDLTHFTNVNGTLFFVAETDEYGNELWQSDGTESGTTLVKDIWPGTYDSNPQYLTNINGILYFQADDGNEGQELWRSDGTASGTYQVKDIASGSDSSSPQNLTNMNGTLFFSANANGNHVELWQSNGTTNGTTLIQAVPSQTSTLHDVKGFTVAGSKLFFFNGGTLWASDGTASGTIVLGNYNMPKQMAAVDDMVYFLAHLQSCPELWRSDGTLVGTIAIYAPTGCQSFNSLFEQLVGAVNGHILFKGYPNGNLWYSDGTTAGTRPMNTEIFPGAIASSLDIFYEVVGDTIYFVGDSYETGHELWAVELPPIEKVTVASQNNNGTMQLSWQNDPTYVYFEVWRSENPFFMLDDVDAVKRAELSTALRGSMLIYNDDAAPASAIGNPNVNHFYWVVGVDANGDATAVSNHLAEFDFVIQPGN